MTFEESLKKAESFVEFMDKEDGWKNRELPMILAALEAGLRDPSTNAAFDAYVMLRDLVRTGGEL